MNYLGRRILLHLYDTYRKSPTREPMTSYGQLFSELKTSLGHSSDYTESLYEPEFNEALLELRRLGYIRERGMGRVVYYELTDSGKRQAGQLLEVARRDRGRTSQLSSRKSTDYSSPVKTGENSPIVVFVILAALVVIGILVAKGPIPWPFRQCNFGHYNGRTFWMQASDLRQGPSRSAKTCLPPDKTTHSSQYKVIGGYKSQGECWLRVDASSLNQANCAGWVLEEWLSDKPKRGGQDIGQ